MTVSLIIPTYNRCASLKKALDSVRQQSVLANEIIVVDDGSTDATAKMLMTYFPRVIYIKQDNKGVSAARNTGIRQAKSEWIAFLDSDDTWLKNKLEAQLTALRQASDIKVCHTEEIWIPLCAMSPSSILIHRSVFDDIGLFDENLPACEDYDLWLRISAKYPVLFLEQPLINKYGGHEDQLSHKHWGMDRFRIQALDNLLQNSQLSEENYLAAQLMLIKKARIFQKGALKRGKIESANYYQELINQYEV